MKKCVELNLTSFGTLKYDCVIKTIETLSFLPLINNSVTIGFDLLLLSYQQSYHQKLLIFCVFILDCNLQYFCRHLAYHLNIP